LHAEGESVCRSDDAFLFASLTGESPGPINFSHKDLFLAEEQGKIMGACRVVPELAIDCAVLRLFIKPDCIERGIADGLLRSALKRAGDLEAANVHADLREKDTAACKLFAGLGFRPVRRYTDMTLELAPDSIPESEHQDLSYHPLEPGGEEEFTQLQNHVFGGAWGFCPNTASEIVQLLNTSGYGHDGVIVSYYGEEAVGYCWTAELRRPEEKSSKTIGRIHMMGIVPEYRRRGFGKHVLWSGLEHLAGRGIQTVELTTDNENKAACSLYEKAGFRAQTALVWYEKKIR